MNETFTEAETKSLAPFFTNTNEAVFGLKLPQEIAGALFSRYSRSTKNLRRTFLDEFLGDPELALKDLLGAQWSGGDQSAALKKARAFFERVLVGYGDDSVAQLGGAHIACEGISNVAVKFLEDARIGIAPLEQSTRYVRFDQKDENGDYLFYREPKIMASAHGPAFTELMNFLFATYSSQIDPMIEFVKKWLPIEEVELRHPQGGGAMSYKDAQKDEKLKKWAETAYRSTVRAQACDILRSYLPAATLTNAGFFGDGQAFEYMITKLYSHELTELRDLAASTHRELNELIPSFVKRAKFNKYIAETNAATRTVATQVTMESPVSPSDPVLLVDYDREAEERVISAILYPHSRHPLYQLRALVEQMPDNERKKILDEYLKRRQHRRDRPGRALEQVYYTFDVLGNLGLYRDLQRHRILTQERQDFTTIHGYDTSPEIEEAGFKTDFNNCMDKASRLYEQIHRDLPYEAQYVVPFAYKIRWYMKMNLREAVHIGELRTMPQGHPDYRFITQEMWRKIGEVHPTLAVYAKFIDWKTYRLGRLSAELRTEYKKSSLEK
ncbi:MAG: FAD-dependent thymidylate synthase [Deltaproteobacteria bacterium]|nr:FAD-dependent thymidylate synthase [Deltaproteobacteria bacterium]